jgi:uncharacterized protein YyaL (SSP411 family)
VAHTPNRLIHCSSPYLRQHAYNPVAWYPWGQEAFERAKAEDRPILLSIGYAACHWCHVMERESFQDEETAAYMNAHFVCVKVDREERPDVDAIYMQAVQAMTGHGGWPLTVFLTPEGIPFYGGTYFPPEPRSGLPSFRQVLKAVVEAWQRRREDIETVARQIWSQLEAATRTEAPAPVRAELFDQAFSMLALQFDTRYGGFGGAPKFPQPMTLRFLLRYGWRTGRKEAIGMACHTLEQMARGGIYDQLGGGFHRYAVDRRWRVPHFEKMLYDNALLVLAYLEAWQLSRNAEFRTVVEETIQYLIRELRHPEGGFYTSQDADSEGEEGRYYTWSWEEFWAVLSSRAGIAAAYYGLSREGNFEGRNVLFRPFTDHEFSVLQGMRPEAWEQERLRLREALFEARLRRPAPERDEKILASQNGMLIVALCRAAQTLRRRDWLEAALRAGEFLYRHLIANRRVFRCWTHGERLEVGFLEDYAWSGLAALALYEATRDRPWLERVHELVEALCGEFWDESSGAFFDTPLQHDPVLQLRPRERMDNAIPAGSSVAAELLLRAAAIWDRSDWLRRAEQTVSSIAGLMARYPGAFGHLLGVADELCYGLRELVLVGLWEELEPFRGLLEEHYLPDVVRVYEAGGDSCDIPLLRNRTAREGKATAYLCRRMVCEAPTTDPDILRRQLNLA